MIQAFREQTQQYKQISEAAKVQKLCICTWAGAFSCNAATRYADPEASFLQKVSVPLNGDANAIKKYADEMQKIKKQVGSDYTDPHCSAKRFWSMSILPICGKTCSLRGQSVVFCLGWRFGPSRGCKCKDGF